MPTSAGRFSGGADFHEASFEGGAGFSWARFESWAGFDGACFEGGAEFRGVRFEGDAEFRRARFEGDAKFGGARFNSRADFREARFEMADSPGPLTCNDRLVLDHVVFAAPVIIEAAAAQVTCVRTRWAAPSTLRLRYASLDLSHAVIETPLTVTTRHTPFLDPARDAPLAEDMAHERGNARVSVVSISGVDATHLVLNDTDLTDCCFAGAVHLDQLRLEGEYRFAPTPPSQRWSRRQVLAEEHHWRASARHSHSATGSRPGWRPSPTRIDVLQPAALAALYRQLRKALEDGKNEPGAADFYYGECEMRRHDRAHTGRAERYLLHAYWLLSGYGLRASRALAWLVLAMTVTILALVLWGIPADSPKPTSTGRQVQAGQELSLTTDTPALINPTGPLPDRLTTDRFERSLRIVINSVVFRSSGQELTTAGTYTEMASRFTEPVLLGLAILAIRSRVKR